MAKQAAAPAPAPAAKGPSPDVISGADQPPEVVTWGNGAPLEDEKPEVEAKPKGDPKPEGEATEPKEGEPKPVKPEPDKSEEEPAADKEEKTPVEKPVSSERRQQIVKSLAAERAKRSMEKQIADAKKEADEAKAALESSRKMPLAQQLRVVAEAHGMTVEDLADRLLIGGDDVKGTPQPKVDPTVAELRAKVEALESQRLKDAEASKQAQIGQAVGVVRESLKDTDLPLIESFDAYSRVMVNAHQAWVAGGRQGSPTDYTADCAAIVEEELKAEYPKAAARLYPKAKAEEAEGEGEERPARPAPRPAVGKRVASKPEAKPVALPLDTYERDEIIKKRFGWT